MSTADLERDQRERAHQSWELVVLEAPDPEVLRAIRKALRVKRFELSALAGSLPGCVRRGARVDLVPLEAALREAGVRCELRRSAA
jgi:hypothetical protein